MTGVSVAPPSGSAPPSAVDPLVLVVGGDLDAVADVAEDLESWGHDPIVHFEVSGVGPTIKRVHPDVVVVVGATGRAVASLIEVVGDARLVAYVDEDALVGDLPASVGIATSSAALRRLVEGETGPDQGADRVDPSNGGEADRVSVAVDEVPMGEEGAPVRGKSSASPTAWVRVLVAGAILVIVASLIFAPPSEEIDVTDDPTVVVEAEAPPDVEPTIDVAALAIPTVAPAAPRAASPLVNTSAGHSGFGGVVVQRDGGAPIAEAHLVITGPSGALETDADTDGRWRVADVRGGVYQVVATSPGLEGAPVQILVGEGQVITGVRVVLGGGAPSQ